MIFALLTNTLKFAITVKISSFKVLSLNLEPQNNKCKLITVQYNGHMFAYKGCYVMDAHAHEVPLDESLGCISTLCLV